MFSRFHRLLPMWGWILLGSGAVVHFGTAALRISAFLPTPQLVDFAAFYSGAWAFRLGESPFALSSQLLAQLATDTALTFTPPIPFNPPFWYVPLIPLTWLTFPAAAWVWVLLNGVLLFWISNQLAALAGYSGRWGTLLLFPVVVTFGPVFLDLTLGQVSIVLLAMALLIGRLLVQPAPRTMLLAGVVTMAAAMIKVYPLVWMGIFAVNRRWQSVAAGLIFLIIGSGLVVLWGRGDTLVDWGGHLYDRILAANDQPSVDDQSLSAWLDRIGRPQTYAVPGLIATASEPVTWHLPWSVDATILRWSGYILALLAGSAVLGFLWRWREHNLQAGFYLWLLVGLIAFPHIERYNHTLLLPAMAWLWSQSERARLLTCVAYFLSALARLTHLWVRILPAPWAPILTGSGLFAVFLLTVGIGLELHRSMASLRQQ